MAAPRLVVGRERLASGLLLVGAAACAAHQPALIDQTLDLDATVASADGSTDSTPLPRVDATSPGDAGPGSTHDALAGPPLLDGASSAPDGDASIDDDAAPPADSGPSEEAAFVCTQRPEPAAGASVLEFHKNPSRDGLYVDPAITTAAVSAMQLRFSVPFNGQIYAQALYVAHGPTGHEIFIAATEANHLTAIDGCGNALWDVSLGIPAAWTDLPCGNIYPTLGITGTPVIDPATRRLYLDAMTQTGRGPTGLRHMIHAVSIDDGTEVPGWPVDVAAAVPGFSASVQNQRSALSLLGGVLYVPYGGHFGDCGPYAGWVVGVSVADPTSVRAWNTAQGGAWDAGASFSGGGFWAPGGLASDGTSIYAVSGNTKGASDAQLWNAPPFWIGGNAAFRLGASAVGPTFSGVNTDVFYPSNWATLDDDDADLGATNAVPFDIGASHYLLSTSKQGTMYVLDRDNLGGIDGALSTTALGCAPNCGIVGTPSAFTTSAGTYVAIPDRNGSTNVLLFAGSPPTPTYVWGRYYGATMVTSTDGTSNFLLWVTEYDGMVAVDPLGGSAGFIKGLPLPFDVYALNPPIAANGRVVVAVCGDCYGPPGDHPPAGNAGQLAFYY